GRSGQAFRADRRRGLPLCGRGVVADAGGDLCMRSIDRELREPDAVGRLAAQAPPAAERDVRRRTWWDLSPVARGADVADGGHVREPASEGRRESVGGRAERTRSGDHTENDGCATKTPTGPRHHMSLIPDQFGG